MSTKEILDAQGRQWQETFVRNPDMFGALPSDPARMAVEIFKKEGKTTILELGGGQGRDTIFFARNSLRVTVLDYSESAVGAIADKARKLGLSGYITALQHDVRVALPFEDESMDGCYSHMLYCMALTTSELQFLSREVRRILRPKGLHIYTVRHTKDPHYGKGIHRGEDMYEVGSFIVHFFSRAMVERLAEGFEIVSIDEFEEAELPRKLFRVTLRKK
ncbi:MAG: class I SAM-dependent methyltransferase [Syntrophales bacterium]